MKTKTKEILQREFARETLKAVGLDRTRPQRRFQNEPFVVGFVILAAIFALLLGLFLGWP